MNRRDVFSGWFRVELKKWRGWKKEVSEGGSE